ncbi:hypothetical protein PPMP20_18820 [Paraburkholderia phymatum]|uniref:Uncharacterized protein n=1 Tax=Paraburkholderia phymatum (strain DSM 17167 / CIP 108236 / LMG 21445 / STM815) TaxID=391038 RepID=B2JU65_PARP8|nr:hypothetical protein [Paraburkholderia phymatum]ACC76118.1 hypothetical protein Bphy_7117 [Paraburkholderia phymatum STM815]
MEPLVTDEGFNALVDKLALTRDTLQTQNSTEMAQTVTEAVLLLVKMHTFLAIQERMLELQFLLVERAQLERDEALALIAAVTGSTLQ